MNITITTGKIIKYSKLVVRSQEKYVHNCFLINSNVYTNAFEQKKNSYQARMPGVHISIVSTYPHFVISIIVLWHNKS